MTKMCPSRETGSNKVIERLRDQDTRMIPPPHLCGRCAATWPDVLDWATTDLEILTTSVVVAMPVFSSDWSISSTQSCQEYFQPSKMLATLWKMRMALSTKNLWVEQPCWRSWEQCRMHQKSDASNWNQRRLQHLNRPNCLPIRRRLRRPLRVVFARISKIQPNQSCVLKREPAAKSKCTKISPISCLVFSWLWAL